MAETKYNTREYPDSIQLFEIDPNDPKFQSQTPIFIPKFNLLISFHEELDNYPYPEPQEQALDEYIKDVKMEL